MCSILIVACCLFSLHTLGNDGDGADSDSEKGNHRTTRKPLMRSITNADNKLTNKTYEPDQLSQKVSNWRHPKANLNRLASLDYTENGQGEYAAHINAAPSSHRSRAHNAFNKFVHQTIDFARRRFCDFAIRFN